MMFIVRNSGERPAAAEVQVKLSRPTPPIVAGGSGKTDFFCVAEADTVTALRASGWPIVDLHDGYYEDGAGGGVGIWGQGRYWEIRDTPFTVKETVAASGQPQGTVEGEHVNVRGAIFGA
ncbi:MAG TPA: hypothetical protein VHY35_20070 [Stellaceae bacterium]|jgi:hypothetical protein|nr:hypothetical protein [Stellaceae bacterium]